MVKPTETVLKPIKETTEDFEAIEAKIKELFRRQIYFPLLKELSEPKKSLKNALEDLVAALQTGRITFNRGTFSGRFNATTSKELRALGAKWDRQQGTFKIPLSALPMELRSAISASDIRFRAKIAGIDKKLAQLVPEEIAEHLKIEKYFDRTLWKTQRDFDASVKGITIAPQLSDEGRAKIAAEWSNNMKLWITDFTKKEIKELRKDMEASVFAGNRYESAISAIQKSYGVSANKAKFLARQETALLMSKYRETKYREADIDEFIWTCVHLPHDKSPAQKTPGNVRYTHGLVDGKRFRWDDPRELDKDGKYKAGGARKPGDNLNPGQDYNCRCTPRPIVRFNASRGSR